MLRMLGISGSDYELKYVKISVYIDPFNFSKQIRLLMKVHYKIKRKNFSNPLYVYFQSDHAIEIKSEDIFDRSQRVMDKRYLKRIGADKDYLKGISEDKEGNKIPLIIREINSIEGDNNKIRIEIIPDNAKMSKILENTEDDAVIESGFMIDTIIKNEGIEKEPHWRRLSGWSRFAWRFHFKVWSITEDMEPVKAVFPRTEQEYTEEVYFTNLTDEIQMFLIIPKSLVESYGQVVTHPGGDTVHIITERDKNTYLISEKDREEDREKVLERIEEWTEEGAMAISWRYDQTGSMSREVIVEHRRAHPRFWTFLTFATLFLILGVKTFPEAFPEAFPDTAEDINYFWGACLILFVFSYFYTNLYNFSFYELKKKTGLRYLVVFLRIPIISIIVVFTLLSRISIAEIELSTSLPLAIVALVFGSALTYLIENEKIKREDIKIREHEKASYMFAKIAIQIAAICFVDFLAILAFDMIDIESFTILFACIYAVTVFIETSEGKAAKWLQL